MNQSETKEEKKLRRKLNEFMEVVDRVKKFNRKGKLKLESKQFINFYHKLWGIVSFSFPFRFVSTDLHARYESQYQEAKHLLETIFEPLMQAA